MHYAEALGDEQRLARVEQVAKAQRELIDKRAPEHRMSTQSAIKRHGINFYDALARQAAAQILIVHQKHRRDTTKHLPWLGD